MRDIVLLNAAAGLVAYRLAEDPAQMQVGILERFATQLRGRQGGDRFRCVPPPSSTSGWRRRRGARRRLNPFPAHVRGG